MPATLENEAKIESKEAKAKFEQDVKKDVTGMRGGEAKALSGVAKDLAAQPRITFIMPKPSHFKPGEQRMEPVTINDYTTHVPYGEFVTAAEEVYLILVGTGLVQPARPEDSPRVPAIVTKTGPAYMKTGDVGSQANPRDLY